ncbi:MAG: hypothetical protein FWG88_05155 [Oscillospiraceae bacterium]|nr:hypothetical protein [Oscillospiraceae bacterium]
MTRWHERKQRKAEKLRNYVMKCWAAGKEPYWDRLWWLPAALGAAGIVLTLAALLMTQLRV